MTPRRPFPFHLFEPRWQARWQTGETFRAWNPGETLPANHPFALRHGLSGQIASAANLPGKYYILDMFPYPSGAGLHVGHPEGYTATDILARYRRAAGRHVLHPMGWDAFGLPAEQYAVRTGQHPRVTTTANIATFKGQIQRLGFSYDWSREVDTTDPGYYRWTQWIFLRIYNSWFNPETRRAEPIDTLPIPDSCVDEAQVRDYRDRRRLAYVAEAPVWWCEALGTVLANEEVVDGRSEVGNHPAVRRPMRQWMLRITAYADRLLADLEGLEWSESLKAMQREWIGRSEGAEIEFPIEGRPESLRVFTTRADTLFGATYMVIAPEHPLAASLTTPGQREAVEAYREAAARKSDRERTDAGKEKTGVFTGSYAINPVNQARAPIWVADYVLGGYGTGAIMAVPAHDERDHAFADGYKLPVVRVVAGGADDALPYTADGVAVDSASEWVALDGLPSAEARERMVDWLEARRVGRRTINFKLRDWLFSRQRYWGEPFPILWQTGADGVSRATALADSDLPLTPPGLEDFKPTASGEPPLARAREWVNRPDGSTRETNTMPQWAGSCWYYLRYLDPRNTASFAGREVEAYWMGAGQPQGAGVDLYVGGAEHAVLHLLYARFWHKVLFDLGLTSAAEPFRRLVNQGLILGEDGQKMSKSRGNVVNPDDVLAEYGADAFRLYEMFMGPLQDSKPWSTQGVEGVYRFLGRVWRLFIDEGGQAAFEQRCAAEPARALEWLDETPISEAIADFEPTPAQARPLHACVKKVTEDLEAMRFNTAISAMMTFVNQATAWERRPASALRIFLQLLAPFAPHIAEELWEKLHRRLGQAAPSLSYAPWPNFDPALLVEETIEIPVQVNGKLRGVISAAPAAPAAELEAAARASEKVQPFLAGKTVRKVIVLPGKLINFVVG